MPPSISVNSGLTTITQKRPANSTCNPLKPIKTAKMTSDTEVLPVNNEKLRLNSNFIESSENKTGVFSLHLARKFDFGFSYFPKNKGFYTTTCITINSIPIKDRFVFTFYTDENYPNLWGKSDNVKLLCEKDIKCHLPRLHKKEKPKDDHYHALLLKDADPDSFLKTTLNEIGLADHDENNILHSAEYFIKNPTQDCINFTEGALSQNGTSESLE
ncbi:hypothetical protein [Endozoicomonas acroporae]|uniref:hypothetical protein n=1 Tax=Endozoicomonas acroporae TaxID=1701104 RepID=UPI0013D1769F|nr:hypothetical protein [Endozoicomonas acroporae]